MPPPFLGTAVVGSGGLTAAVDAYGDVVDLRAPGPAGRALIDNPADRQAAGTRRRPTPGSCRGSASAAGAALPLWRADSVAQRYLPGTNVVRTAARFGRVRVADRRRGGSAGRLRRSSSAPSGARLATRGDLAMRRGRVAWRARRLAPALCSRLRPACASRPATLGRAIIATRPRRPPLARPRRGRSARGARLGAADVRALAADPARADRPAQRRRRGRRPRRLGLRLAARRGDRGARLRRRRLPRRGAPGRALPARPRPRRRGALRRRRRARCRAAARRATPPAGSRRPRRADAASPYPARSAAAVRGATAPTTRRATPATTSPTRSPVADVPTQRCRRTAIRSEFAIARGLVRARRATRAPASTPPRPGRCGRSRCPPLYPGGRGARCCAWPPPDPLRDHPRRGLARDRPLDGSDRLDAPGASPPSGERRPRRCACSADLRRAATPAGALPERVDARTGIPRSTTPLAWSHAFAILALRQLWPETAVEALSAQTRGTEASRRRPDLLGASRPRRRPGPLPSARARSAPAAQGDDGAAERPGEADLRERPPLAADRDHGVAARRPPRGCGRGRCRWRRRGCSAGWPRSTESPGTIPITSPPASRAPRAAASITPPRPPQTTVTPASASRRPTSSASIASLESCAQPLAPMTATCVGAARRRQIPAISPLLRSASRLCIIAPSAPARPPCAAVRSGCRTSGSARRRGSRTRTGTRRSAARRRRAGARTARSRASVIPTPPGWPS